jgi:ATP-dependent DNA ligase
MIVRLVVEPMLLSSARAWPPGPGWVLEPKWDGFRRRAAARGGRVRCWTRHGTPLIARGGAIAQELLELLPDDSLVDGELVALGVDEQGRVGQDFARLAPAVFGRRPAGCPASSLTSCGSAAGRWPSVRGTNGAPPSRRS